MESVQALMAAEAADTIIGFVHRVTGKTVRRCPRRGMFPLYDDNPEFNDSVDEEHGMIRIYEAEFRPSEVLFQMEPESYRVYLVEFGAEAEDSEASAMEAGPAEVAP